MSAGAIRVLVVDDSLDLANLYARALSLEPGLESAGVLSAADDLVATCRERKVDVVLLDLTMPGKDPLAAVTELRAALPECRVLVFSGFGSREYADQALSAGAWGYLGKEVDLNSVISALRRVVAGEVVT